jgi:hypothetical protein
MARFAGRGGSGFSSSTSVSTGSATERIGAIERVTVVHSTRSSWLRPRRRLPSRLAMGGYWCVVDDVT